MEGPQGGAIVLVELAGLCHPAVDEKHYRQLPHRLGTPLIREVLASLRRRDISAATAAEKLGLGRTRLYELYADYLRAAANRQADRWQPGASGGDHAPDWPAGVEPLLRKLLATKPPAPYRMAASEVLRRLGLTIDPATVRRWAISHNLAHPLPKPRPPASLRRWQCLKTGALWQLDATPHRWFPGDKRNYPLLDLLDDCSRVCTGAAIYHSEDLLAYLDFLPAAFTEHGIPLELYVDCHGMFFPQRPDALTQLGAALHFYGVSLRYARTPQAKGKIERQHQYWQGGCPRSSRLKPSPPLKPPMPSCPHFAATATPGKSTANSAAHQMTPRVRQSKKTMMPCVLLPAAPGGPTSGVCARLSKLEPMAVFPSARNDFGLPPCQAPRSSIASIPTETSPSSHMNPIPTNAPPSSSNYATLEPVRLCSHAFVRL
jgi:hypothetical protein